MSSALLNGFHTGTRGEAKHVATYQGLDNFGEDSGVL